jgi:hypothetical protein
MINLMNMKNKKALQFGFGKVGFNERFLVMRKGESDSVADRRTRMDNLDRGHLDAEAQAQEESVRKSIAQIYGAEIDDGPADVAMLSSLVLNDNNPYSELLGKFKFPYQDIDSKDVTSQGTLVLKYANDEEVTVGGLEFAGLFWPAIEDRLVFIFKREGIRPSVILKAARAGDPKLEKLILEVAKTIENAPPAGPKDHLLGEISLSVMRDAADSVRTYAVAPVAKKKKAVLKKTLTGKKEAHVESGSERDKLKAKLKKVPKIPFPKFDEDHPDNEGKDEADVKAEFMESFNDKATAVGNNAMRLKVDWPKIIKNLQGAKLNPGAWDHTTPIGVQRAYNDFRSLNLIGENKIFYNTMFGVLGKAADYVANGNLGQAGAAKWFAEPDKYAANLKALDTGLDWSGKDFYNAYRSFNEHKQYLKKVHSDGYLSVRDGQMGQKEDSFVEGGTKLVKDNLREFARAVREKDWGTAGMYAVGIYAFWKTYQNLSAGKHGDKVKKWLFYGAAAYVGNIMLKKGGIDLLKIAGLKDEHAEVKGTPAENLFGILKRNKDLYKKYKTLDPVVVLSMQELDLRKLDDQFEAVPKGGIGFIDPAYFPGIVPDEIVNLQPFHMALGERGLATQYLAENKLSADEKEYIRWGRQIYLMAASIRDVYQETLFNDENSPYYHIAYEDAIRDKKRSRMKIWHLLFDMGKYVDTNVDGTFERANTDKVDGHLGPLFDESDGFVAVEKMGKAFTGTLRGYPIVIVPIKGGYNIYPQGDYGDSYKASPGTTNKTFVPNEGAAGVREAAAGEALKMINKKMQDLLAPLQGTRNQKFLKTSIRYSGTAWTAKVKLPGSPAFDIPAEESTAVVEILPGGKALRVKVGNMAPIRLDEEMGRLNPLQFSILRKIGTQKEFEIFNTFQNAGMLRIGDYDEDNKTVNLLLGDRGIEVELKYNSTTKKFTMSRQAEKGLLERGSGFSDELRKALKKDHDLEKMRGRIKGQIENLNEDYLGNFVKEFPGWFTNAKWGNLNKGAKLKHLSGSVAKNYTKALVDIQINAMLDKVVESFDENSRLSDLPKKVGTVIVPGMNHLKSVSKNLGKLIREGDDVTAEKFDAKVMSPLAGVGMVSDVYKGWHRKLVNEVFEKYGGDDFREARAVKARKFVGVYNHYTAHLDIGVLSNYDPYHATSPNIKAKIDQYKTIGYPLNQKSVDQIGEMSNVLNPGIQRSPEYVEKAFKVGKAKESLRTRGVAAPTDIQIATQAGLVPDLAKIPAFGDVFDLLEASALDMDSDLVAISEALELLDNDVNTTLPDLQAVVGDAEKDEARQAFIDARDYSNYVIDAMMNRFGLEDMIKGGVPAPGSGWNIDHFNVWVQTRARGATEFIDTTPPLRMMKDYVTLDEFLELDNNLVDPYPADPQLRLQRLRLEGKEVVMPRKPSVVLNIDPAEQQYVDDFIAENALNMPDFIPRDISKLEKVYIEALHREVRKLQKTYKDHVDADAFTAFLRAFIPAYSYDDASGTLLYGSFDAGGNFVQTASPLFPATHSIETQLSGLGRPITREEQAEKIALSVKSMIEKHILDPDEFNTYFTDPELLAGARQTLKHQWANFKFWLIDLF